MANNLTGDFDVVAEFALPAVNRILAAMHQCERLLHSIAVRVDDHPLPGSKVNFPTAVGVVDSFGDATVNHKQVSTPVMDGAAIVTNPLLSRSGIVVNPGDLVAVVGEITPSNLQGVAQLQLYAPTVSIPPQPNSITVTTNVMVRYFADKNTAAIAEFMRGDLNITAPMNKIASGRVHVLNIDFKAQDAVITFTPSYTSKPLSPEDLAAISLCIQNGLRTSFLPSSVTLPGSVADVQLKTLPGAVAVLLNMNSHPASGASVTNVFVGAGDDFAFAAGRDYIFSTLRPIADTLLGQPPISITVTFGYHFRFEITLNSADFDLQPGKILFNIKAHAKPLNHTWVGSADFTISVEFFLQASGNTVQLGVGNVSISFDSSLTGAFAGLVDFFTGNVSANVKDAVMNALNSADAFGIVDRMFNTDTNLAQFLNAQLAPPDGSTPVQPQQISLTYTTADIQQAGVVLRGLLLLKPWPDANVEYEPIPASGSSLIHNLPSPESDYSALKSWIPGGRVDQYEWSYQGQTTPFEVNPNKFVLRLRTTTVEGGPAMPRIAALSAYSPLCLTVRGTRVRNYGPGDNPQPVVARVCGYRRFPLLPGMLVSAGAALPIVALAHPGPNGQIVVTGHTGAQTSKRRNDTPNLLVHFADAKTATKLEALVAALEKSERNDAATAVLAVVPPGLLAKSNFVQGVTYSEDPDGAWQKVLRLGSIKPPFTAIVSPASKIVWEVEGLPDGKKLIASLSEHLTPIASVEISTSRLNARIGQPAPNFVFEFAPGSEMPLSKLRGRGVVIVFWKVASRPSIEAVRAAQAKSGKSSVLLAINDGDPAESARAIAAESAFSEAFVADPQRIISAAYGVELWPTVISVNAGGIITAIRFGFDPARNEYAPTTEVQLKQ